MIVLRCKCCTRPEIGGRYFLVGPKSYDVHQNFERARRFGTVEEAKAARDELTDGDAFDVCQIDWLVKSKPCRGGRYPGQEYFTHEGVVWSSDRSKAKRYQTRAAAKAHPAVRGTKLARVVRVLRKVKA